MKKSLILALAVVGVSLTGCTEEEVVETEPVVIEETAPVVTEPADDMILDDTTTVLEEGVMTEENVIVDTDTTTL